MKTKHIDEIAKDIISDLDEYATDVDPTQYGLPLTKKSISNMVELVLPHLKQNAQQLQEENDRLKALVGEWVSVYDQLPEVGGKVLILFESDNILMGMLYLNGWMAFYKDSFCAVDEINNPVVGWMPLPQPPQK